MTDSTNHQVPDRTAPAGADPAPGRSSDRLVVFLVAVLVVAGVGVAGVALGRSHTSRQATITVTGSGTVQGTPDTLSFQIGVQTTASSAAAALEQNNARVASVESSLLGHGVKKKDLQTSGLNIYQNTDNKGNVTGFSVVDTLNVTTHQLGRAGAVIDAAAHAAGNGVQLYGVSFSISNESKLLAAARAQAMRNARTQASQVAGGGGASLGSIIEITDQENSTTNPYPYPVYSAAQGTNIKSVPIQTGSQSISVQVKVIYALHG